MELTVVERLLLLSLLPAEGEVTTLRIVRQLREALSFSEQEHEDLHLVQDGGRVTWDVAKAAPKEVAIGRKGASLIADALTKLSETKKLGEQHLGLYDKFVEAPEADT